MPMRERVLILLVAPLFNSLWASIGIFVTKFTLAVHANLINNMCGLFILLLNLIFRKRIHALEVWGSYNAVGGALIMMYDPAAEKADGHHACIWADMVSLVGGACGAMVLFSSS